MVQLLIRAFHALKDTKTPLIITIYTVLLYILGNGAVIYATDWGVIGIAAVTSLVAFVELLLFVFLLNKKMTLFNTQEFWVPQGKMIVASFLMAIFLYLPFKVLDGIFDTSRTIELILLTITTGTIGMLVYIYFAALFEIKELALVTRLLDSMNLWKKSLRRTPEVLVETSIEDDTL